ncbi:MAG: PAS domain-containing protein [Deltaproteobacteria bacterium]|jgi:PAS domain S-box-containing protein|nr:PAS domain-containing protein [Deltaproteobacteria bacterium]
MTDFLPVLLRVIIVAAILFYLVVTGRKGNIQDQKGWRFILAGFTLIFFGLIISILDLFDFTDSFFFLLLTQHQNFLERTVGYTLGFLLLGIGFYHWVPGIVSGRRAERKIGQFSDELALNVTLRTRELTEVIDRLEQEIANRKRAEEALSNSQELYSNIVESMGDGIMVLDVDFNITYWNQAMENISQIQRRDAVDSGKLPWDLVPHLAEQGIDIIMKQAMAGTATARDEIPYRLADGSQGFTSEMYLPLRTAAGDIRGIVGIIRDITEKRRLENHLQQTKKLQAVAEMASGIAHDFNNMLTSVVGFISLAKMNLQSGRPAIAELEKAEKIALRSSELSDTLISFSRANRPVKKKVFITAFLKRSLHLTLSGSNIRFEFSGSDDDLLVEIDESQVAQAIYNIIKNAKEAMPSGGELTAKTKRIRAHNFKPLDLSTGEYVRISISDQGAGIKSSHLDRIFDPYFSTKQRGTQKGMGLGLSIAHSIIKKHRGNITVKSAVGKGSTFYIYLPLAQGKIEKPDHPTVHARSAKGDIGLNARKILIMDDEKDLLEVAGKLLNRLGFETDFAACGEEAVQKYQNAMASDRGFDAVILDLTVKGGMGGTKTMEKLLNLDPDVVAFVSSGYAEDTAMVNYREHGFSGVIVKPYNIHELGREISKVTK